MASSSRSVWCCLLGLAAVGCAVAPPLTPEVDPPRATVAEPSSASPPLAAASAPVTPVASVAPGTEVPPDDPQHPRAKVLASFREDDGSLVLHLAIGTDKQVKVGMKGHVLVGPEGNTALEGGEFTITKVLGAAQSTAKIFKDAPNLGGSTRTVVHLIAWP